MSSWWERFPGRLDAELGDFAARGLDFELYETLFRDAGRVLLRGTIDYKGKEVELEVLYPDVFPYMRPEVYAPGLVLERHQNPVLGNLCLLDRASGAWRPEETAAFLVDERVRYLLGLFEQGQGAMAAAEVPQGEPLSVYFQRVPGTAIFVPASALELDSELRVGSGRLSFGPEWPPQLTVRALLAELTVRAHSGKRKIVARADEALARRFGGNEIQIRWVRSDGAPAGFDAAAVFKAAEEVQPGFGTPPWQKVQDGEIAVTGVIFEEEVRQNETADAWLFGVRFRRSSGGQLHEGTYTIGGERLTEEDLGSRIPRLASLRNATIAQVGLGALGAPLALELARNQAGNLRLLEGDYVEAAQVVRWPFGVEAVGHSKLDFIATVVDRNYPYTRVERFSARLGDTATARHGRNENELDGIARLLHGASLVVDASAEIGVQQLISDFAREQDISQVYVTATEGARGGQVALIVPGRGGCWHCWKLRALEGQIPLPPFDADGTVQPRGCASPTFTGASFDLLPITAQAARVAIAAIDRNEELASTVWVCGFLRPAPHPPEWSEHQITVHPNCPHHDSDN